MQEGLFLVQDFEAEEGDLEDETRVNRNQGQDRVQVQVPAHLQGMILRA